MKEVREVEFLEGWCVARFSSAKKALEAIEKLRVIHGVKQAELLLKKKQGKRSAPSDPFYAYNAANPGYQWHLNNTGQNGGTLGLDINVESVWGSYTGSGVKIGIVDDGVDTAHPDLNLDTTIDHNWNSGSTDDPSPTSSDKHGTATAGVAAAVEGNAQGGVGVAYDAQVVGLRLTAEAITDLNASEALSWESGEISIYNNSWGPIDGVELYEGAGSLTEAVLADRVVNGRNGKGSIYVWAAGNGKRFYSISDGAYMEDNSNYDGYANLMETIAVGAIDDVGNVVGEKGANIVVVAPSYGGPGSQGITTTDLVSNGSYYHTFSGTSAATPQVSGVVALMLEANPNLGWRDVQEILMASARRVDAGDEDWFFNGGGFAFNHKYGSGLVDAQVAVTMAQGWTNLAARTNHEMSETGLSETIPNFTISGLSKTFDFSGETNLRVEHVEVEVDISHTYVGDLAVTLVSPSGKRSVLSEYHFNEDNDLTWTFMSVHHWGEDSSGEWKVEIRDLGESDTGTLNSVVVRLHGVPQAQGSVAPRLAGLSSLDLVVGKPFLHQLSSVDQVQSYTVSGLPDGLFIDHDGLIYGVPTSTGESVATVTLQNASGSSESLLYFMVNADSAASVAQAIGWSNKAFTMSGSMSWSVDGTEASEGSDSAKIAGLQDYESASLTTELVGPGTLTFDWKVSSEEDYDHLELVIDGVVVERISGVVGWNPVTRAILAGSHRVEWRYSKDYSGSDNQDSGWLDKVSYVQSGSYEEWANAEFSVSELADESVSGSDADPDDDDVTNLMEFFRGSDPKLFNQPSPLAFDVSAGVLELRYDFPLGLAGMVHGIEYSDNLEDWTFIGSDFDQEAGGLEKRVLMLPQDQQQRFYRLKVLR